MRALSTFRADYTPTDPVTPEPGWSEIADLVVTRRIGGAFWHPPAPLTRPVLVCAGGEHAAGGQGALGNLLSWVLRRHAAAEVVLVAPHPHGRAVGLARRRGVAVVSARTDPHTLLDGAARVYGLGLSDLADLGALRGLAVLRHDGSDRPPQPWTRADACHGLVAGTHYINPYTGRAMGCRDAIAVLALWRRTILSNRRIAACAGMSLWKRRRIAELFATAPGSPPFIRRPAALRRLASRRGGAHARGVAVWATRMPRDLERMACQAGLEIWRVEDGFIRSVGLGSGLQVPCSIFLDRRGIYYDPSRPSDLEHILATHPFDAELRGRARALIERIVAGGISKYGVDTGGQDTMDLPGRAPGQRVILVPGQVSDDMSVRLGGGRIATNLDLLRAVRSQNIDAFILYRPHPDVDAGHRAGALDEAEVREYVDQISRGGAISTLLSRVDEVHTLTSLTGFEALLRGLRVVTYGAPFYAGWGLTTDLGPVPRARRHRNLTVEELVAGTLLLYPSYIDPVTRLPCEPEMLIDRIQDTRLWRPTFLMKVRELQGRAKCWLGRAGTRGVKDVKKG
ncbi:capsular polysaccharide export protein, LipB/KpsS family [Komagataeibacter kakiaceti]